MSQKLKNKHQCPRCSSRLQKLSGFEVCANCGHTMGSQSLTGEFDRYDDNLARSITRGSDEQARPFKGGYKRRRVPLNFDKD